MSKKYREVRKKDDCLSYYGRIEVEYVKGSTTGFTFDLCEVINCKGQDSLWRGFNVWACYSPAVNSECLNGGSTPFNHLCSDWGNVVQYWSPHPMREPYAMMWSKFKVHRDFNPSQNPITMSIGGWGQNLSSDKPNSPLSCRPRLCNC